MNAQIKALDNYMNVLDNTQVDDLVYNKKDETLQLSAKGTAVGSKVSVRDMMDDGIPVVDLDSTSGNDTKPENGCDCNHDCDCEDNVVEFGYSDVELEKPTDDNNVVEF